MYMKKYLSAMYIVIYFTAQQNHVIFFIHVSLWCVYRITQYNGAVHVIVLFSFCLLLLLTYNNKKETLT